MKSTMIAAAAVALVVGVAAVGGTSVAGPFKLKPGCWPGFIGSTLMNGYCSKTFYTTCPKNLLTSGPKLTHLGGTKWRVGYGYYKIQ